MAVKYFSELGSNSVTVIGGSNTNAISKALDDGLIEMVSDNVDPLKVALADGTWVADLTLTELAIEEHIQAYLDEVAFSFGFRGTFPMDRAVNYLSSTNLTFAGYATQLSNWRDAVWTYVETEKAKVGVTRTMPTKEEFLAEIQAEPTTLTPVKV